MDQPGLDPARHFHALRGLERINRVSASSRFLWPPIRSLALTTGGRALRILDIASGAGDVAIRLWQYGRRAALPLEVAGCDLSPQALAFAQQRAAQQHAEVNFFKLDVLQNDLPEDYDVIISSLFLHHLHRSQAVTLLTRMRQAARRLVLINDLRRGVDGFLLAWLGVRVLSTSDIVRIDGPRSVEAAWTADELRALAHEAGLEEATVVRRWPCRLLLSWRRP